MKPFKALSAGSVLIPTRDIDTDQIIPARFLKVTDKVGLGQKLFNDWRYAEDGSPLAGFPLNESGAQGAQILVAGDNFGCGSSREHAPWALVDWGFRAIISTSFADIFTQNALKNGLLPICISEAEHAVLTAQLETAPNAVISVDLGNEQVTFPNGQKASFPIEGFAKNCLLDGVDQLGYLKKHEEAIAAFEASR